MTLFVSPGVALSLCVLGLHTAVLAPAAPAEQQCRGLTSNIQAHAELRRGIEQSLEQSPTLRGQCARIGAARQLRVRVSVAPNTGDMDTRARSVVRRFASGLLTVDIELPAATTDFIELLAHEFEHVIEVLDGVDLRALAARAGGHVTQRRSDGAFESDRARAAGRAAAAEAQRPRDPVAAALGRGIATLARAARRMTGL